MKRYMMCATHDNLVDAVEASQGYWVNYEDAAAAVRSRDDALDLIVRLANGPMPDGRLCWCSEYEPNRHRTTHALFCDEALSRTQHYRAARGAPK